MKYCFYCILCVILLSAPAEVINGFEESPWNSSLTFIVSRYNNLKKLRISHIKGITIFGKDTMSLWSETEDHRSDNKFIKKFYFLNDELRMVDVVYDSMYININYFKNAVLNGLIKRHGKYSSYEKDENDFMITHYFRWINQTTVIMAMCGHFKEIDSNKYDWIKIRYYEKKYYELKQKKEIQSDFLLKGDPEKNKADQRKPARLQKNEETRDLFY
ncbi:MAG: hypothetical protein ABIA63_10280 [bacterium]